MSKKITKYKLLDSKTYIKRKELLSKCISKCDPSKKDEQLKVWTFKMPIFLLIYIRIF